MKDDLIFLFLEILLFLTLINIPRVIRYLFASGR